MKFLKLWYVYGINSKSMKFKRTLLFLLLTTPAFLGHAQSYFIMPENFYLQKGQKIDLRLLQSEDFTKQSDFKFQADKTAKFELYQAKQKIDLKPRAKDTGAVISMAAPDEGLALVDMVTVTSSNEMSRSKFLRSLDEGDPD